MTVGTAEGNTAITNIAARLVALWNAKYSTGSASAPFSFWVTAAASAGVITAPSLQTSLSGSRAFDDTVGISWSAATSAQVSAAWGAVKTYTNSVLAWKIGSTDATTDNGATATALVISVEEAVAGNGKVASNVASLATNVGTITQTTAAKENNATGLILATNKIGFGTSSANSIEGLSATGIFPTDARGDVVYGQTAEEGTNVTTGTAQAKRSRIHWLG